MGKAGFSSLPSGHIPVMNKMVWCKPQYTCNSKGSIQMGDSYCKHLFCRMGLSIIILIVNLDENVDYLHLSLHYVLVLSIKVLMIVCFAPLNRQVDDDKGRNYELEQSAVKCMRGILFCYMRQAAKVKTLTSSIFF